MYDFEDDDFDGRNARRRRRPAIIGRPGGGGQVVPVAVGPRPGYGYPYPAPPWAQAPMPPPVVDRFTGSLKLGLIIDAASQALAAMSGLPSAPPVSGDGRTDTQNLVKYQEALAQHAKRDEQIRTIGALARLFLV